VALQECTRGATYDFQSGFFSSSNVPNMFKSVCLNRVIRTCRKGDRVLLKKVGFKGKHKLANKWERDPYIMESQPDTAIPVYALTPERDHCRNLRHLAHPYDLHQQFPFPFHV
jgi:hypothetical protein